MPLEKKPSSPAIVKNTLNAPAAPGDVLPAGVVRYDKPLTPHDYMIADPMNQAAADAVIYKTVCDMRQSMEPGARLYVVMGERHDKPTNLMAQPGLIENMAVADQADDTRHGALLYTREIPYNDLQFFARNSFKLPMDEAVQACLHEYDLLGHVYARAMLANNYSGQAPQSLNRIFNTCLQYGIPMALVDAGCDATNTYLCSSDALACSIAGDLYKGLDLTRENIPFKSEEDNRGTVIRNAVMAWRIVEAAERHMADTIVTGIGVDHLGGRIGKRLAYDTSLTAVLKRAIRPQDKILSVFFSLKEEQDTAEQCMSCDFWQDNPQTVIMRGVSEESHYSSFGVDDDWAENSFIERLGRSHGKRIPDRFNTPALPDQQAMRRELRQLAEQTRVHAPPEPF